MSVSSKRYMPTMAYTSRFQTSSSGNPSHTLLSLSNGQQGPFLKLPSYSFSSRVCPFWRICHIISNQLPRKRPTEPSPQLVGTVAALLTVCSGVLFSLSETLDTGFQATTLTDNKIKSHLQFRNHSIIIAVFPFKQGRTQTRADLSVPPYV